MTERFNGLHLPHTSSVFEALVLAIMGQQISTHVARVIRGLFIETHGPRLTVDGRLTTLSPGRRHWPINRWMTSGN